MKLARLAVTLLAVPLFASACDRSQAAPTAPESPLLGVGPTARVDVHCPSRMDVGTSAQCVAYGYDASGNFTSHTVSAWSSSSPSVAGISSTGSVSAQAPGNATIYATIAGVTGSTVVTVVAPLTVSVSGPLQIQAKVTCRWWASASGGTAPYSYSWSPTKYAAANYNDWSQPLAGSYVMTVQVTDAAGRTATASQNVTVTASTVGCLSLE